MDKEHAKFILESYRPDGADANNPDFAEALQLAAEDRELGQWLCQQRAHDAAFSEALCSVDIPDGLRDEILAVMDQEEGGMSEEVSTELDAIFVGALVNVSPPVGLRNQIISAMEVEHESAQKQEQKKEEVDFNKIVKFPMRWLNVAAIAALLLLGAIFWTSSLNNQSGNQVDMHLVQMASGKQLNVSNELEFTNTSLSSVNSWLVKEGLPEASTIPKGLISMDTEGGKRVKLDNGVEASMVHFREKEQEGYYLMVLKVGSVEDFSKLQSMSEMRLKACRNCPMSHYNVIAWRDDNKAYMILSKQKKEEIMNLF